MRKQAAKKQIKLSLDTRNRVCLTQLLPQNFEISSFNAYNENGKIILEPLVEVSIATMNSISRGINDIKEGRISELERNFSEFVNDDEI